MRALKRCNPVRARRASAAGERYGQRPGGGAVVRMKPLGSFGPGEITRAIRPAMKPIMMIQTMFHTTISHEYESTIDPNQTSGS